MQGGTAGFRRGTRAGGAGSGGPKRCAGACGARWRVGDEQLAQAGHARSNRGARRAAGGGRRRRARWALRQWRLAGCGGSRRWARRAAQAAAGPGERGSWSAAVRKAAVERRRGVTLHRGTRACSASWRHAGVTQTRERHGGRCRSERERRRAGGASVRAMTRGSWRCGQMLSGRSRTDPWARADRVEVRRAEQRHAQEELRGRAFAQDARTR
jgi:hypothetical protein